MAFSHGNVPQDLHVRKKIRQDLAAEALSQDTERLEIDITLGAGAVDPQSSPAGELFQYESLVGHPSG